MTELTLDALARELADLRARVAVLEARAPGVARPIPPVSAPVQANPIEAAKETVAALFAVALNQAELSEDDAFQAFRELVHADRRGTPLLDEELRAYKWRPLVQRCLQYLSKPEDPKSFFVERCQPEAPGPQTEILKLYLRAEKRMPPPITLRRDPSAGGAWRLEASSL
jgi:hypothetical protein